jgi:threonine aldolase
VVLVEQTSNLGGGAIWPLDGIQAVCDAAHKHGMVCHMDGARLLNAVAATGVKARTYADPFDSLWIDFSKGLGAPVGAALAGSKGFIKDAWRWKHQFGGAMRQAGIIAAGAVYALNHHVARLPEDNENAQILARGLAEIEGIVVEPVETNLIFFDVSGLGVTAEAFNALLRDKGLRISVLGKTRARAVTHLDVSREQVKEALEIIRQVAGQITKRKTWP